MSLYQRRFQHQHPSVSTPPTPPKQHVFKVCLSESGITPCAQTLRKNHGQCNTQISLITQ